MPLSTGTRLGPYEIVAPFGDLRSTGRVNAVFSPDGRWVAYGEGGEGTRRLYVEPWPRLRRRRRVVYGDCMSRMISTTVRLNEEDVRALKRARAAGHSASDLVRKGLRVVASRYYTGRRPPTTRLFESTDTKLGDESELFGHVDE